VITFESVQQEAAEKAQHLLLDVILYGEAQRALAQLVPGYREDKDRLDAYRHRREEAYVSLCEAKAELRDAQGEHRRLEPTSTHFELLDLEEQIRRAEEKVRRLTEQLIGLDAEIGAVRTTVYALEGEIQKLRGVALPPVPPVLAEWLREALSDDRSPAL
jgi:chromosome segregation ATPase